MEEHQVEAYKHQAAEIGTEHGYNAGTWVFDGNTDEGTIRRVLQMIEDGDPEWEIPAPLSGEWADGYHPDQLLTDVGFPEELRVELGGGIEADIMEAYEEAYYQAYEDEVVRSGRAVL
jgi:hypothetical protein